MANSADFIAHVLELMRATREGGAPPVFAKAMFGGHGIYVDRAIVGIVIDDVLYLKTDETNRAEFAALDLEPFAYVTRARARTVMSYHRAPDEALESAGAMAQWLRSAMGAALRSAHPGKRRARSRASAPSQSGARRKSAHRRGRH